MRMSQPVLIELKERHWVRYCRVIPLEPGLNALSETEDWHDFGAVERISYAGADGMTHKMWVCLDPAEVPHYGKTRRSAIAAALEAHGMIAVRLESTAPPLF